jgi:hypothetical protein
MLLKMVVKLTLCRQISWRYLIGSSIVSFWMKCRWTLNLLDIYVGDHIFLKGRSTLGYRIDNCLGYVEPPIRKIYACQLSWSFFSRFGDYRIIWKFRLIFNRFAAWYEDNTLFLNIGMCKTITFLSSRHPIEIPSMLYQRMCLSDSAGIHKETFWEV